METVVAGSVEELYEQCRGRNIHIYGAKTVALRTYRYLESKGEQVSAFLVSNQYKNPDTLLGKQVLRIEETDAELDCVVVAVSEFIWEIEEFLHNYTIQKTVLLSPFMLDTFPTACMLFHQCHISPRTILAEQVQIVADETSGIVIEDGVMIGKGMRIFATDGSQIYIRRGTYISGGGIIEAGDGSRINIGGKCSIGKEADCLCEQDSQMISERGITIGRDTNLHAVESSLLELGENCSIGESSVIGVSMAGKIEIGKETTFNSNLIIYSSGTLVHIGEDNMFSYYVKVFAGQHILLDGVTNMEITNYTPIHTAKHVWVGVGATLLPGCDVGEGSVVGASSVVTGRIPDHCTCAGNPAKVLRKDIRWER